MEERHQQLLERAERVFGARPVEEVLASVRAIVGADFPKAEALAREGMATLKTGKKPTPSQCAAIEHVIKIVRPSLMSMRGQLEDLPDYNYYPGPMLERWERFRTGVKPYLASIGRIDGLPDRPGIGTGFLVAPDIVVTNRHVVEAISRSVGELEQGQAMIRFQYEYGPVEITPPVPILSVICIHASLDMALLRVEATAGPALPIEPGAVRKGDAVAAVGYPSDDSPRRNPLFVAQIFQGRFGVERAAPGEITGLGDAAVYHDCSTLGGNSGSPMIDMESCRVIGLHRDGPRFLYRNEAVDGPSLHAFVRKYVD